MTLTFDLNNYFSILR